jgi:protein-disulfide isomerase
VLGAEKVEKENKVEHTEKADLSDSKKAPATSIKKPQTSSTNDKAQGIEKSLNYIEKNYPQNIVKFTTSQSTTKATLTIFTDYTCPHCKALHEHLPQLLKQGYSVNYILMPRAGANSKAAHNMQKALCAENQQTATAYLYQNGQLPKNLKEKANCQVEMKNNLLFADGFGVVGTPTIISSNGKVSSGFSTVYGMLSKLDLAKD